MPQVMATEEKMNPLMHEAEAGVASMRDAVRR